MLMNSSLVSYKQNIPSGKSPNKATVALTKTELVVGGGNGGGRFIVNLSM